MDVLNIKKILSENARLVESTLEMKYTESSPIYGRLYEAQRYSLLAGGKRIRPSLVLESCKMFGGDINAALPFATAVEMVHTYSLIHDDLPCMDNDDLRRGKPTNHKVFGEATAVLAADGLLTDAFLECAMNPYVSGDCAATAVSVLSAAAGSFGMVKGQAIDMYGEENQLTLDQLLELHMGKTGAMICASVQLGCLAAGITPDDQRMKDITEFAQKIGLVFQIVDDVLDVTSNTEQLGKSTGSDKKQNKTTFMSFFTVDEAMKYADTCTEEAIDIIEKYEGGEVLVCMARYLCQRNN